MNPELSKNLRILAISSTPASTKFLHRVRGYIEPQISMTVLTSEQLQQLSTGVKTSTIKKRFLLLPSIFISVVSISFLYLVQIITKNFNSGTSDTTPITKWFSYVYSIKIEKFYGKKLSNFERMLSSLKFPNIDRFLIQCQSITKLVISNGYNLLLLPGENILLGSPLIISHARKLNLPSVIYDFAQAEKSWKSIFTNPVVFIDRFQNFIAIRGWKKYEIQSGNSRFSLPIFAQTIAEVTGNSPRVPWSACGGIADEYLAPSERFYTFYNQTCMIDDGKINKIVSVEKSIAIQMQQTLETENTLGVSEQILILLPPDQFGRGNSGIDSIFSDWLSIVDRMLEISSEVISESTKIVAALHPRAEDRLQFLTELYPNIKFTKDDIVQEIVQSKLVFSSTSSLDEVAADLEIPTVIWNVYGYQLERNYQEFSFIECVDNRLDPTAALKHLINEPSNVLNVESFGTNLPSTLYAIAEKHGVFNANI
jgi:hypothetical protein